MSGGEERTEKATPKRMKELRRDGSLQKSQDLSAWLGIGVAAVMMPMVIGSASRAGRDQLTVVKDVIANPDAAAATAALSGGLGSMLATLAPLFGTVVLTAVAGTAVQGGIHVSGKALKPKLDQLNVAKGIKRVFSVQSLWQGGKAALKTAAIGMVLYSVVQGLVPMLLGSGMHSLSSILQAAGGGVSGLVRTAVIAGLVLAAFDVVVIMRRNRKKTRMTKKEIRDEMKQSEGDPLVKGQIRSRQLAMSRNRMIASVADADVVLVNPTHVAVALRYEPGKGAPRVIAKGKGHVAARIRAKAAELHVPMIEDVPLARALHSACEVGQEIPAHLYVAVAKVLAFVMALRRRGAATGVHRAPTGPTRVEEMAAA